jgi:hypothetical protein
MNEFASDDRGLIGWKLQKKGKVVDGVYQEGEV